MSRLLNELKEASNSDAFWIIGDAGYEELTQVYDEIESQDSKSAWDYDLLHMIREQLRVGYSQ